jgi:hypothetical protein
MMMLTFSSVSVSVNTFAAERFTSCRHIIAGQLNPSQQKNIFMANQSAHQLGHIKARSVGVEPTINRATGVDIPPAPPPYCRSCDLTLP